MEDGKGNGYCKQYFKDGNLQKAKILHGRSSGKTNESLAKKGHASKAGGNLKEESRSLELELNKDMD